MSVCVSVTRLLYTSFVASCGSNETCTISWKQFVRKLWRHFLIVSVFFASWQTLDVQKRVVVSFQLEWCKDRAILLTSRLTFDYWCCIDYKLLGFLCALFRNCTRINRNACDIHVCIAHATSGALTDTMVLDFFSIGTSAVLVGESVWVNMHIRHVC